MKYRLHPEAGKELEAAAAYYFEQSGSTLSQAFLREFELSLAMILQYPHIGTSDRRQARRAPMRKFPYTIVYSLTAPENVIVLAVAHQSRRPGYWKKRQ